MDTVVDRLIRYAKVYSESDYHAGRTVTPSTDRQFDMATLLVEELHGLGIENARYDDKCYVYATLDAIGYMALTEEPSQTYEAIETLGSFYRQSLSQGDQMITVEKETAIVNDYVKL